MQPNVKQQNVYNDYDSAQDPTTHHLGLVHVRYTYIYHIESMVEKWITTTTITITESYLY